MGSNFDWQGISRGVGSAGQEYMQAREIKTQKKERKEERDYNRARLEEDRARRARQEEEGQASNELEAAKAAYDEAVRNIPDDNDPRVQEAANRYREAHYKRWKFYPALGTKVINPPSQEVNKPVDQAPAPVDQGGVDEGGAGGQKPPAQTGAPQPAVTPPTQAGQPQQPQTIYTRPGTARPPVTEQQARGEGYQWVERLAASIEDPANFNQVLSMAKQWKLGLPAELQAKIPDLEEYAAQLRSQYKGQRAAQIAAHGEKEWRSQYTSAVSRLAQSRTGADPFNVIDAIIDINHLRRAGTQAGFTMGGRDLDAQAEIQSWVNRQPPEQAERIVDALAARGIRVTLSKSQREQLDVIKKTHEKRAAPKGGTKRKVPVVKETGI